MNFNFNISNKDNSKPIMEDDDDINCKQSNIFDKDNNFFAKDTSKNSDEIIKKYYEISDNKMSFFLAAFVAFIQMFLSHCMKFD